MTFSIKGMGGSTSALVHFPIKSTSNQDGSNLSGVAATNLVSSPASAPTVSAQSTTGGQISGNQTVYIGYTYVTSYGESTISPLLTVSVPTGTNTNYIELNLPTIPSGVTGLNFYWGTSNAAGAQYFNQYCGSTTNFPFFYTNPGTGGIIPPTSNGAYSSILNGLWQRDVDESGTLFTPTASVAGTYTSGGFICPDTVNSPGIYELGIPSGALSLSGGARQSIVSLWGANNMAYTELVIDLVTLGNADIGNIGSKVLSTILISK